MRFAPKSLGYKLRLKRAAAGISQKELSTLLGKHPSPRAIHGYETGQRRPNADNLRRLNEFLDLDAMAVNFFVRKSGIKPRRKNARKHRRS